ncbi:FAD-dependent oxidoreductase [Caulobacter sp. CCNWLY153]|uniref:FAD-dependent oxidoreductase n=1 Tax=unclassified Caulobacter TaxID=2648921 RepID=UPI002FEF436C
MPNVFFIGPYGRRVSFASQQRRVLNTVWAMEQAGCIARGDRVAVIGAGLAGVMATVALAARGARVWLYEEKPSALRRQSLTNHRWVHPSINFWPEETLEPSTRFPFFDWTAGICDDIVKGIDLEWKGLRAKLIDNLSLHKFHTNTPVLAIERDGSELKVVPERHPDRGGVFKSVLVTTGFGREQIVQNTNTVSYWEVDQVEDQIRDSEFTDFLVSGTGDGGLIDTLRLLHRDFDTGKFCLNIAHALNQADASKALIAVERSAQRAFVDARDAELAAGKVGDAETAGSVAAALKFEEGLAQYIAGELPAGVEALLDSSLIQKHKRQVKLVGRLPRPYSLNAAPIHKLLIAHAFQRGVLVYHRGQLEPHGPKLVIKGQAGLLEEAPQYSIARHGSELPVERFIQDDEERLDLKARQEQTADWLRSDVVPMGYYNTDPGLYPPHDVKNKAFIYSRFDLAREYVEEVAGGALRADVKRERCFVAHPDRMRPLDLNKLPSSLFGIDVKPSPKAKTFRPAVERAL